MERHIQTVIQIVITALLMWVGSSVLSVRESAIRIEESHKGIATTIARIELDLTSMKSTLAQVQLILNNNNQAISDHEKRIVKLETKR